MELNQNTINIFYSCFFALDHFTDSSHTFVYFYCMKTRLAFLLCCLIWQSNQCLLAQNKEYEPIDAAVKSMGKLDSLNMGSISYLITKKFSEPEQKVRAIFDWIAYNIAFDCKAARSSDDSKILSDEILKTRKATAKGYAALFQDMCSVVKIRCLTVDGYVKKTTEDINNKPDELNHTWAVVQLGNSPDAWYYVDPTYGSGYTDDKMTVFTPAFNDAYFFTDRALFNAQHFPDNPAWLLGGGGKTVKDFFAGPVMRNQAYKYGVTQFLPTNGLVKTKLKKDTPFSFKYKSQVPIEIVALQIGNDKKKQVKTADFKDTGNTISFNFRFEVDDTYPVTILINNEPVLSYQVEVSE